MADRDFILAPNSVTISIQLEQAYALIHSLMMIDAVDEFPGLDKWVYETTRTLPKHIIERNQIVVDGFYHLYVDESKTWSHILEIADYVENADPIMLRDKVLDGICTIDQKKAKHFAKNDIQPIEADALLGDVQAYMDYVQQWKDEPLSDSKKSFLKEMHHLLTHPEEIGPLVSSHLREMWNTLLKKEWERSLPMLAETVSALQRINFDGMDSIEVARQITGRDMSNTWIGDLLEDAEHLIFVPVPYIGPYVGALPSGNKVRILFRPRVPEGTRTYSPALDRSELLVRLNALADDTRLLILEQFRTHDELYAQDVIQLLDLSQSAASRHLRQLTATGYLTERRKEGAKCYSLNRDRVESTLKALQSFLIPS